MSTTSRGLARNAIVDWREVLHSGGAERPFLSGCLGRLSSGAHADLRLDLGPGGPSHHAKVVVRLQIKPDFGRNTEVLPEPERGIRRDRPLAADDLADTVRRNVNIPGQPVDAD